MNIRILNQDRKAFAATLAERTGEKSKYLGAPSFGYQVGPYIVKRDGSIEVSDEEADLELLRELYTAGLIDNSWDTERETMDISIPVEAHDGNTLTNLLKILYSRGEIISRAIGCAGAFEVTEDFLRKVCEENPQSLEDFMTLWNEHKGNEACSGICIDDEKIHFDGFPLKEEAETVKAYMDLVSLMSQMSLNQKRVNIEKPDLTNEKYSFRVWLLRLGMKGDEYKETRRVLLSKLSGHAAFRTKDQEEIAKQKNKAAREALKAGKEA